MTKAELFKLRLLTPDGEAYNQSVSFVRFKNSLGEVGVLPGHSPLISDIVPSGLLIRSENGQEQVYFVPGGIAHIHLQEAVLLVPYVEHSGDIDKERAKTAEKRAVARLAKGTAYSEKTEAWLALQRAKTRLLLVEKRGS